MSTAPTSVSSHPERIVVIMPNWLGDGVMATPFLRALRLAHPQAYIAALALPLIVPVLTGLDGSGTQELKLIDEIHPYTRDQFAPTMQWLQESHFDTGYLLPNSFRSAWLLYRAGIPHRIGYAREGRGWLLTQKFSAEKRSAAELSAWRQRQKEQKRLRQQLLTKNFYLGPAPKKRFWELLGLDRPFKPVPTISYYLRLLNLPPDQLDAQLKQGMVLDVTREEDHRAAEVLSTAGVLPDQPLIVMVPGANFGSSKCWAPERFAAVATALIQQYQAWVVLVGAPTEKPIIDAIVAAVPAPEQSRLLPLTSINQGRGISLGAVKALVRRSTLMICNDTGPRHFACAWGAMKPQSQGGGIVTLFGPTDPVWAETFYPNERQVAAVPLPPCGPCQLKKCPLDHRCMKNLTVEQVLAAVHDLAPLERK